MRVKFLKFNLASKNAETNWENVFSFWDNCIWIGSLKLSLLRREYFSLVVNVLRNSLENLHITKRDDFELNCFHMYQRIWERLCRSDLKIVSSNLDIFSGTMRAIFFFENFENLIWLSKIEEKIQKMFFLSKIIASEMAVLNCLC